LKRLNLKDKKGQVAGENLILRSFRICAIHQTGVIKSRKMGTYLTEIYIVMRSQNLKGSENWGDLGIGGLVTLK
jgi:hypothetical protein